MRSRILQALTLNEEEPQCPPIDVPDLGPPRSEINVNIVVKKHPEDKFMDCPVRGVSKCLECFLFNGLRRSSKADF